MTRDAWIALGGNLGDRAAWLERGLAALDAVPGVRVIASTASEETEPLGGLAQPRYLNCMALAQVSVPIGALLAACQRIEREAGRDRSMRWSSRTLDIDLVRVDGVLCDTPELMLPHPGLRDRTFWAREIAELEDAGR